MPKEGKVDEKGKVEDTPKEDPTKAKSGEGEEETWADKFKTPQELADEVNRQHDIIEKTKTQNTEYSEAIQQAAVDSAVMSQIVKAAVPDLNLDEVVVDTRSLKVDGRSGEVSGIRVALPEQAAPTGKTSWKPRFPGTSDKEAPGKEQNPDDLDTAEGALAYLRGKDKKQEDK